MSQPSSAASTGKHRESGIFSTITSVELRGKGTLQILTCKHRFKGSLLEMFHFSMGGNTSINWVNTSLNWVNTSFNGVNTSFNGVNTSFNGETVN